MIQCRLCGVRGYEAKGVVLQRVNEKGVKGIWECRPICGAQMSDRDALEAAIEGVFDGPFTTWIQNTKEVINER